MPFVALPSDCDTKGWLAAELEKAEIPFAFMSLGVARRKYFSLLRLPGYCLQVVSAMFALHKIIRKRNVQIIHSNTLVVFTGALAAKLTRTRHIWHVHEILVSPKLLRRPLHFLATHLSDVVICISNAVKQHILKDQPRYADKLVVIHNGLSLTPFLAPKDGARFRVELGIPDRAPLIGMVGRINQWKGQTVFVNAAKLVLARIPEAYFVVVGSVFGDQRHFLDKLKSEIGTAGLQDRFLIADFRKDTTEALAAFDVYVHPSILPEPFGLVVLEAMASGKAVIVSAHGGPLEMIEDGISGYLVEPKNPNVLAEKIIECLENPDRRLAVGAHARERALSLFAVSRYIAEVQGVYEGVLPNRQQTSS
ncbi:MAG: glycosyltransferase family 4 protein [Terracidiphilus sp.]